jgi:hypothetical protein
MVASSSLHAYSERVDEGYDRRQLGVRRDRQGIRGGDPRVGGSSEATHD